MDGVTTTEAAHSSNIHSVLLLSSSIFKFSTNLPIAPPSIWSVIPIIHPVSFYSHSQQLLGAQTPHQSRAKRVIDHQSYATLILGRTKILVSNLRVIVSNLRVFSNLRVIADILERVFDQSLLSRTIMLIHVLIVQGLLFHTSPPTSGAVGELMC